MPRRTPIDRLDRLVDVATAVFIERGYRRTQMADVAAAMSQYSWIIEKGLCTFKCMANAPVSP